MISINDLSSGDVLLFDGHTPLHDRVRKWVGCRWTQVALVVRSMKHPDGLVFESTIVPICSDVIFGEVVTGVQLTNLEHRLRMFQGDIAARRLAPSLSLDQAQVLSSFVNEMHGLQFRQGKRVAVGAFRRKNKPSDGSAYFCSELLAAAYLRCNLISPDVSPSNHIPADFSSSYASSILQLTDGHILTAEEEIAF